MIQPVSSDNAFLSDVKQAPEREDVFHLWWLGQSGYLVKWQNRHLLIDPYLSDSLTQKYAGTDKPHVRMTGRVIAPQQLNFVDVVSSSHNHTDHLDAQTIVPLLRANSDLKLIAPEANRSFVAERLNIDVGRPLGVDDGTSVTAAGFEFFGIPAAHEELERDQAGRNRFLGYIIRFGSWTLYHSGDTLRYEGMVERLKPWSIDVALLPINGRKPQRRVAGNLSGPEAARLSKEIGARLAIPCHYEMFEFNTASPGEFIREAEGLQQSCRILRSGERWSSYSLQP